MECYLSGGDFVRLTLFACWEMSTFLLSSADFVFKINSSTNLLRKDIRNSDNLDPDQNRNFVLYT